MTLPFSFAAEFDALFHRNDYLAAYATTGGSTKNSERANSWEFPILLKYKLPISAVKPFIEAGIAPRTIFGTISASGTTVPNPTTGQQVSLSFRENTEWSASVGVVMGGGVRFGVGSPAILTRNSLHALDFNPDYRVLPRWAGLSFDSGPSGRITWRELEHPSAESLSVREAKQFDIAVPRILPSTPSGPPRKVHI